MILSGVELTQLGAGFPFDPKTYRSRAYALVYVRDDFFAAQVLQALPIHLENLISYLEVGPVRR